MKMLRYLVSLVSAASVLFACSSPTQSVTFKAPAGWQATPSFFGFQAWHTSDDKQDLVLFKLPVTANMNQALSQSNFRQFNTTGRRQIKICGNQAAIYISGTGTGARGAQSLEMVITTVAGSTYMAMYARDAGVRRNAQAETAIRSLCPRTAT